VKSNCVLKLYLGGASQSSLRALKNLAEICAVSIPGDYEVSIVDVTRLPMAEDSTKIVFTPTLHKLFPLPERRVVADLADHAMVLRALDLPPELVRAEDSNKGAPRTGSPTPITYLVASNEVEDAIAMKSALGEGAQVLHAATVAEATSILRIQSIQAMLLHCDLAEAQTDLAGTLRELRGHVPILAVVEDGDESAGRLALDEGAVEVVKKGLIWGVDLGVAVRRAAARHRAGDAFRRLLDASPDGILILDAARTVLYANLGASRLLGEPVAAMIGHPIQALIASDLVAHRVFSARSDLFLDARASVVEWQGRACEMVCLRDVTSYVRTHQTSVDEVTSLRATNERLQDEASHDPLTGVLNRRGLTTALLEEVNRATRTRMMLSALILDCDDFKRINDALGHAVGDAALRIVAEVVSRSLRPQDRLGRIGGDEFLVLLPGTRAVEASVVGERVLHHLGALELPEPLRGHGLTVSIGVAEIPSEALTVEDVIAAAGQSLKLAKLHGKHRVSWTPEPRDLEGPATGADRAVEIAARDLRMVAQGIVRLADDAPIGQELLVRGPRGEMETPATLFELARTVGRASRFDFDCLRLALACGSRLPLQTRRHVNVLPETMTGAAFNELLELLSRRGDPSVLCVELSCREILGDPLELCEPRRRLHDLGVIFGLDDAQFERNTLEYLLTLRPDVVKISRNLVTHAAIHAGAARDLGRLARAARQVEAEVIAVGVESRATADLLRELGIEFAQGFLWGGPTALVYA